MSVVSNAPATPALAPAYQNAALARAHDSARLAYEKICAERRQTPLVWPGAHSIALAAPPMAFPMTPAMQLPQAYVVPSTVPSRSGSVVSTPALQPMVPGLPGVTRQFSAPILLTQASPLIPQRLPVSRMTSAAVPPVAAPKASDSLLDPVAVDKQKLQVARNRLDRLQSETAALTKQNQERKKMLAQYAAQQKAQHATQVDSDLQRQALAIEQRGSSQLMQVQQAVNAQKSALEQQAATLVHTYRIQKAEEDRLRQFYGNRWPYEPKNERNTLRDVDSFDCYLGRPGGRPKPPPLNDSDD